MPYKILELTEEQKKLALDNVETTDISGLVQLLWPDQKTDDGRLADGRSMWGRSVKTFLASEGKVAKTSLFVALGPLVLTPEQEKEIENLGPRMPNALEIARAVFKDTNIQPLSREYRAVYAYYRDLYPESIDVTAEPVEELQYQPPVNIQTLVGITNRYVSTSEGPRMYLWGKMSISEEKQLHALLGCMRIYTFKYVASQFDLKVDRELFVSTFVRWAHDKPDLTQIEVDQMILAAAERVNIAQIERTIQRIERVQRDVMASGGEIIDENGKKRKLGMTDVEMINQIRTKHDAAKGRLDKLMDKLEESRSDRHAKVDARSGSILNLFDAWRKNEEQRQDILKVGKNEKEQDAREVGRIRDLDDVTALICGQTIAEAQMG